LKSAARRIGFGSFRVEVGQKKPERNQQEYTGGMPERLSVVAAELIAAPVSRPFCSQTHSPWSSKDQPGETAHTTGTVKQMKYHSFETFRSCWISLAEPAHCNEKAPHGHERFKDRGDYSPYSMRGIKKCKLKIDHFFSPTTGVDRSTGSLGWGPY
jgi:hypothetical protein